MPQIKEICLNLPPKSAIQNFNCSGIKEESVTFRIRQHMWNKNYFSLYFWALVKWKSTVTQNILSRWSTWSLSL